MRQAPTTHTKWRKRKEDVLEPHIEQACDPPSGDGKLDSPIPQDEGIAARTMHRNIAELLGADLAGQDEPTAHAAF